MLDQNITSIIVALISTSGFGLSIANYLMYRSTQKDAKKRELKTMLEDTYKCIQEVSFKYKNIMLHENPTQYLEEILSDLRRVEITVNLYIHPLKKPLSMYKNSIKESIKREYTTVYNPDTKESEEVYATSNTANLKDIQKQEDAIFDTIVKIARKKGYSYT